MADICKYCLENVILSGHDQKNSEVVYPCKCTAPIHQKCIQKWYKMKKSDSCEICLENYAKIEVRSKKNYCKAILRLLSSLFLISLTIFSIVGITYPTSAYDKIVDVHIIFKLATWLGVIFGILFEFVGCVYHMQNILD